MPNIDSAGAIHSRTCDTIRATASRRLQRLAVVFRDNSFGVDSSSGAAAFAPKVRLNLRQIQAAKRSFENSSEWHASELGDVGKTQATTYMYTLRPCVRHETLLSDRHHSQISSWPCPYDCKRSCSFLPCPMHVHHADWRRRVVVSTRI